MIFRTKIITFSLIWLTLSVSAQEMKRPMNIETLVSWQRISNSRISDNGQLVAVKHEPWKGDATVVLFTDQGNELARFSPAGEFSIAPSSRYLVVEKKTALAEIEELKLKKTKPDKMPLNKLIIYSIAGGQEEIDSIRTYKLSETEDWLAYQRGDKKDSTLYIRSLNGAKANRFPAVSDYGFAQKGAFLYFVSAGDSTEMKAGLYSFPLTAGRAITIKEGGGDFKKATFNEKGEMLAFLYVDKAEKDSTKEKNNYALFLSQQGNSANLIVKAEDKVVPEGWIISPEGEIVFSKDGEYLFFPTSPEPRQQDTTVLAENRPDVQIWNWNETVQYTQQHVDRKKEAKKTYKAVYNISSAKSHLLNTLEFPELQIPEEGNFALISTSEPYGAERMWRGKSRQDIYAANMRTGERVPLVKAFDGRMSFSPSGKYVFWYQEADSAWFTCELSSQKFYKVSSPETFEAWDKNNDVPDYPKAYGAAGWSENDQYLLLYDQHDIWKFSPTNSEKPVNLTGKGKKTEAIRYRFQRLDKEQRSIDLKATQFLVGFNEKTKTSGFYSTKFDRPTSPKALLTGDFKANFAGKAKNAEVLLYTTEGFSNYPEIRIADLRFKKNRQLTNLGNQQDGFLWGTAELTSWISLDGDTLEGVIYKPANFDPQKKYPLIVNFYERNSDNMFSYRMPEPGRSTIDYHFYNSNGYIIFNPDVRYKVGHPGESCFNCVIPGIESLIAKGYIDEKAIGAQGHSWGGYQVAYLATRTSLFAAIESGAPVVNMFSAYGGIRWGTGLNRSFQYEHGQSRIGATPWENPLLYKENSPLFTMDKVSTPILILHNDADGHVPWYQGIEYFIALKRLQKPVWLLNYPGEPHWPTKMPNRIDFQLRMFQFFEHYLKKVPAPKWMSEGVKAVDQPFDLGY